MTEQQQQQTEKTTGKVNELLPSVVTPATEGNATPEGGQAAGEAPVTGEQSSNADPSSDQTSNPLMEKEKPWHEGLGLPEHVVKHETPVEAIRELLKPPPKVEYKVDLPDGLPKEALEQSLKHSNATQDQVSSMVESLKLREAQLQAEKVQVREKNVETVKQMYGEDFKSTMDTHLNVLETYGSPEFIKEVERTGLDASPEFRKFLDGILPNMSNDLLVSNVVSGINPMNIEDRIEEVRQRLANDPQNEKDSKLFIQLCQKRDQLKKQEESRASRLNQ